MEHSDIFLSAPQEACEDQNQPGVSSISTPNPPPKQKKNKYIEKKEVKKEKVFRNCNFSEGFSCRMGQSRVQIQRLEFTVEGRFYSAGLMIKANTGV